MIPKTGVLLFSQASASGSLKIWAEAGRTSAATRVGRVSIMLAILSGWRQHHARDSQRITVLSPVQWYFHFVTTQKDQLFYLPDVRNRFGPQKMHVKRRERKMHSEGDYAITTVGDAQSGEQQQGWVLAPPSLPGWAQPTPFDGTQRNVTIAPTDS